MQVEIPPAELVVRPGGDSVCWLNFDWNLVDMFFVGAGLARKNCLSFDLEKNRLGLSENFYAKTSGFQNTAAVAARLSSYAVWAVIASTLKILATK